VKFEGLIEEFSGIMDFLGEKKTLYRFQSEGFSLCSDENAWVFHQQERCLHGNHGK